MLIDNNTLHKAKNSICPTKSKEGLSQVRFPKVEPEMVSYRNALGKRGLREARWKTSC